MTIGMALIARNVESTIRECVESFINEVDKCAIVLAGTSTDQTLEIVNALSIEYPDKLVYEKYRWDEETLKYGIDDFSAARNRSFSLIDTDWIMWVDADDIVYQAENIRLLAEQSPPDVGAIWFPYHYSTDEFYNVTTRYERERLLRRTFGWIWKSRLHETVSPLQQCQYVRTDKVIILHRHLAGTSRGDRNFRLLHKMMEEDPNDKRLWLYMGHQHFAGQDWMKASEWYLKFGIDEGTVPLERYQALCYCAKAMREMLDPQAIEVATKAILLFPTYKDAYLEVAQTYFVFNEYDKAIQFVNLSETKGTEEPPDLIFINPLEYSFNKYNLLASCYMRKGDLRTATEYMKRACEIRPTKEAQQNVQYLEQSIVCDRVSEAMKILSVHLLDNKEIVKLPHLLHIAPYWFRETPEYKQIKIGVEHYTKNMESKPEIVEGEKSVTVNIGNAFNLKELLDDLDTKYPKVTVISPKPFPEVEMINPLCQDDLENLIVASPNRHIINLRDDEKALWCEYDQNLPDGLLTRIYVGQGLEYWNPKTIEDIGCGGSETSVALLAKALAQKGNLPLVYAMDNQVWDGVIYRNHSKYIPEGTPCNLFISSRVPEVFNSNIAAWQKYLWMHDIHCWNRLTPEICSELDGIIALSHWHADHIKRAYPYLKDCEVIDMDNQDKIYEDEWTPHIFDADGVCMKLPKIIILGDAIDTERFKVKAKKIPNRFIWCSSPDRGLEELLNLWPLLKARLPDATLKIFYGWNYFNSSLFAPSQRELKERLKQLIKQDGVEWCERIGQKQLAIEMTQAEGLIYPPPHDFRETYGITFLEAQAAGVICFYRMNGALGETIGGRGVPLRLDMSQKEIVDLIVNTLSNKELCGTIRKEARKYASKRTWSAQAEKLLQLYRDKEEGSAKN